MSQKDKQLLLKVLCELLPYSVKGKVETTDGNGKDIEDGGVLNSVFIDEYDKVYICIEGMEYELDDFKPYLRPMESLTKEERIEIGKAIQKDRINPSGEIKEEGSDNLLLCTVRQSTNLLSWMNANYIDYRGLIPMGLALPAPEGMYK